MLLGLTSRCTRSRRCAASSAPATCPTIATARAGSSGPSGPTRALRARPGTQRIARDKGTLRVPPARVVDRPAVGVGGPRGQPRLTQQPLAKALVLGQGLGDDLQGHRAVE